MTAKEPINLKELIENGAIFNVNLNDVKGSDEEDAEEERACRESLSDYANLNCLGSFDESLQDEDTYVEGQPFEVIGKKMIQITEDGCVKKRIIREGYGEKPAKLSTVKVHYNGYIEYDAEPFDSTYARKRPHQFSVNNGEVIVGLDIAVQSMKLNEKAQFLIEPEYAYGKMGCLNRIPPNVMVLFEIELVDFINDGAALSYNDLSEQKQQEFNEVYKYCLALCAKAKDLYGKNKVAAIKDYNIAVTKLEKVQMNDYCEQEKQEELLKKLYTNLVVAYTAIDEPRKSCINFNKLMDMTRGSNANIPAKVYYNNSRCLSMLGDYHMAMKRLKKAHSIEPKHPDIATEMLELQKKINEYHTKETKWAKAVFDNSKK